MKGEVVCETTGNPSTQTKENEAIQLETTHLFHASAQCVATCKYSESGKNGQLSRGCTSFVSFRFVTSLLSVAA